ncbi:MAG TPA: hypothetical protein VII66_03295 [Gemmatimonadaceae bacterium]
MSRWLSDDEYALDAGFDSFDFDALSIDLPQSEFGLDPLATAVLVLGAAAGAMATLDHALSVRQHILALRASPRV